MREKGLRATGCNSAIQALNVYLKWSGSQLKIPKMKESQLILPTFTASQVSTIVEKSDLLLFANRRETRLGRRNVLRDVKLLCKRLGFDPPARTLHACRHTFAINYLRRGGSVFHLQKYWVTARLR